MASEDEDKVGPAVALSPLRPGQPCMVIRDATGSMFVRAATDEDVLAGLVPQPEPDDGASDPLTQRAPRG